MDSGPANQPMLGYRNPPIAEAVIAMDYDPLPHQFAEKLVSFADNLRKSYPEQSPRYRQEAQVQFGLTTESSSKRYQDGVICYSEDRKQIAQFSLTAAIFSRLAPYGKWEDFEQQARPLWEQFARRFDVLAKTLGVRYVNRIEIPTGEAIETYLRTYPEVSRALPQLLNQYFLRMELPVPRGVLTMQQGFVPASKPNLTAILLDNDLRYTLSPSEDVWQVAQFARAEKNRIFEACITNELRVRLNDASLT